VKISPSYRSVLLSILAGTHTPYDVREFVRSCYTLALPLIRKRIIQGRINLESLGLKQPDLIYDCIADLFVRDAAGQFTEVGQFFKRELGDPGQCSDQLLFDTLRRIVFGRVNSNLIRIHSEVDPSFGRILHNLDVSLTRTRYFEKFERFGETFLACCDADLLLDRPPAPGDFLSVQLSQAILIHDSMPVMLGKIHGILGGQNDFQRVVSLLWVVAALKDIYALGAESDDVGSAHVYDRLEVGDSLKLVADACGTLRTELFPHYVQSGKTTNELFDVYVRTTEEILSDSVSAGRNGQKHFFEYLAARMPLVTKEEYIRRHKQIIEYFVKVAKSKVREELERAESAGKSM
jgi:hypothetical protein